MINRKLTKPYGETVEERGYRINAARRAKPEPVEEVKEDKPKRKRKTKKAD